MLGRRRAGAPPPARGNEAGSLGRSTRSEPWAKQYYLRKRAEGKSHTVAVRALGNVWVRILFAVWSKKVHYEASTFEAWGRRGPDWKQAYKLGVFYEDNASKRRWVAKSTDKKTLDQIDAVFVTVEPNGGSQQPTGKPLLFAYLKVTPNHP